MPDEHAEREAFLQDLARQIRIRVRAGKSDAEVADWLRGLGLSGETVAYLLATCPRGEIWVESWVADVMTGPLDVGKVPGRVGTAAERQRERKERRKKSRHLAETEPDATFALPGDSYAQVLARDARRPTRGRAATVVLAVLVSLPLGLGLLSLLLIR